MLHVQYAVRDRDAMMEFIERTFDMKPLRVYQNSDNEQSAEYDIGQTKMQITSSAAPTSAVGKFLTKNGPGVFNLGWSVDDFHQTARMLAARGTRVQQRENEQNGGFKRGAQICDTDPNDSLGLVLRLVGK